VAALGDAQWVMMVLINVRCPETNQLRRDKKIDLRMWFRVLDIVTTGHEIEVSPKL
jgi:hypothetical protein